MRLRSSLKLLARAFCAISLAAMVSGCSDFEGASYVQYGELIHQLWNQPSKKVSYETASLVPYASIGIEVGDGPQTLLVLTNALTHKNLWTSPSHIVVVTRKGRIVSTAGLARNLTDLAYSGVGSPQAALKHPGMPQHFIADFADLEAYSVSVTCVPQPAKAERITILGHMLRTLRVDERCRAPSLNWAFTDSFWLDPNTGLTWQSRQHIQPHFSAVTIQLFRPVG